MENIDELINKLKGLNLLTVPNEDVLSLLQKFGNVAFVIVSIHPGQFIIRGRSDKEFFNRNTEDQISYIKDLKIIPQFNRASLEGKSVFYGATTTDEEEYCQVLSINESTSLIDPITEDGNDHKEYITMGKWRVEKEIKLAVIAHHEDFHQNNNKLKDIHKGYEEYLKQFPDKGEGYLKIAKYLSSEFAKKVKQSERYYYKISAGFSEIIMSKGLDGVMYPTAKDEGKGFNVALNPESVDRCLKLEKVVVWRLIKRNKKLLIVPYLFCNQFSAEGKFIWTDPGNWLPEHIVNMKLNEL